MSTFRSRCSCPCLPRQPPRPRAKRLLARDALVRAWHVSVAPVMRFFGHAGREGALRLLGVGSPDYYGTSDAPACESIGVVDFTHSIDLYHAASMHDLVTLWIKICLLITIGRATLGPVGPPRSPYEFHRRSLPCALAGCACCSAHGAGLPGRQPARAQGRR